MTAPAGSPPVVVRRVRTVVVPLHAGRALHVALESDPDGSPVLLRLAEGWTAGSGRPDPARVVQVPAAALDALRGALDALDAEGET